MTPDIFIAIATWCMLPGTNHIAIKISQNECKVRILTCMEKHVKPPLALSSCLLKESKGE